MFLFSRPPRRLLALVTLGLVAASCGSLGEPYLGSFPTSSIPDQQGNASSDDGVGAGEPTSVGDVSVDALPPRPAGYVPSIVVVTSDGIGVIDRSSEGLSRFVAVGLDGGSDPVSIDGAVTTTTSAFGENPEPATSSTVPSTQWAAARDDLFGGLVLQATTGEVLWFPGTGGEPRTVAADGDLMDVGYNAGTPEALTARASQVSRIRLIDNDATVFLALEAGEELIDLSSSGSVVAVAKSDSACGSVDFVSADGGALTINPFDSLVCLQAARPTVGAVAMSPDGEAVAFTIIKYREDGVEQSTDLRAIELISGAEILSAEVGFSGDVIDSLAFDGSSAVLLRRSSVSSEVVVVDADSIEVADLEDAGTPRSVTFARLPLANNLGG